MVELGATAPGGAEPFGGADLLRPAATPAGRIGPNAITQLAAALLAGAGAAGQLEVFERAGLTQYLTAPPERMVDEHAVAALHQALVAACGPAAARAIAADAGRRTGGYLLAHRIPRPAQRLLRWLPADLAARALMAAIRRHAWTFAGSGRLLIASGRPWQLTIEHCPICRQLATGAPACAFYVGALEHLFQALVHPLASVEETQCAAAGAPACRFALAWPTGRSARAPSQA